VNEKQEESCPIWEWKRTVGIVMDGERNLEDKAFLQVSYRFATSASNSTAYYVFKMSLR